MTILKFCANFLMLSAVILAARNHIFSWVVGIVSCFLYGIMFYENKLYADVTLQVFFVITNAYAWYHWLRGGSNRTVLPISKLRVKYLVLYGVLAAICTLAYGKMLHTWTDASFPFVDSIILAFSILAHLLLMGRILESWYFWILVDSVAVPLYFAKGLYLTSGVYSLILINAIMGLLRWKKLFREGKG